MTNLTNILATPAKPNSSPERAKMLLVLQQNEALITALSESDKALLNEFSKQLMVLAAKAAYHTID